MSKYAWIIVLLAFVAPAAADNAVPDLRGTWKGESQSIVLGGTPHHPEQKTDQPRLTSVAFTLVIESRMAAASPAHSRLRATARRSSRSYRAPVRSIWSTTTAMTWRRC